MENLEVLVQNVLGKIQIEDELQLCTKLLNSTFKSNITLSSVDHLIRKKLAKSNYALEYINAFNLLSQHNVSKLAEILQFLYILSGQQNISKPVIPSIDFMEQGFMAQIPKSTQIEMDVDEKDLPVVSDQEKALVKDLFFVLQGISGNLIDLSEDKLKCKISFKDNRQPCLDLLMILAEVALNFRKFISTSTNSFLIRSIQIGVENELRKMQELSISAEGVSLSVLHVYAHVFPYIYRYHFIYNIFKNIDIFNITIQSSDQILSYLTAGYHSGDELKVEICESFLALISKPYVEQIFNWMVYGELNDPFNEFFIVKNDENLDFPNEHFWTKAFYSRSSTIPFLNDIEQRKCILEVGKSSRLLSLSDNSSLWVIENSKLFSKNDLNLRDRETTLRFIKKLKLHIDNRLMVVFKDKFGLRECLKFMRDVFFTRRGDLLLEIFYQLKDYLEMPAKTIIYEVSAVVDICFRQNYTNSPLFNIKLSTLNFKENSLLWSCLCFRPEFPFPMNNFFDSKIIKRYQGMFGFFNSLKYVYFRLNYLWKNLKSISIPIRTNVPQFKMFLRKTAVWNQQYVSIISQILFYSLYEVVENDLKSLDNYAMKEGIGFQELIEMHNNVVKNLRSSTSLESDPQNPNFSLIWELLQELHKYTLQEVIIVYLE
eukprot:NODE_881_length_3338_cov_0.873726.p1 type:complete len:656 gc:universal NODE_881_length_3338_cov_0.873726:359-2326(+)